jgi:hypothetical protein
MGGASKVHAKMDLFKTWKGSSGAICKATVASGSYQARLHGLIDKATRNTRAADHESNHVLLLYEQFNVRLVDYNTIVGSGKDIGVFMYL